MQNTKVLAAAASSRLKIKSNYPIFSSMMYEHCSPLEGRPLSSFVKSIVIIIYAGHLMFYPRSSRPTTTTTTASNCQPFTIHFNSNYTRGLLMASDQSIFCHHKYGWVWESTGRVFPFPSLPLTFRLHTNKNKRRELKKKNKKRFYYSHCGGGEREHKL